MNSSPPHRPSANRVSEADRSEGRREIKLATADPGLTTAERDELVRLRRENRQLKLERERKVSAATFSLARERHSRGRLGFCRRGLPVYEREPSRIPDRCYSAHARRVESRVARMSQQPSVRAVADAALPKRTRTVHLGSRQTQGEPNVHAELREQDERHSPKRIGRLMREAGLVGASHRRGSPITTWRDQEVRPVPDLVDRNFAAKAPNWLWVADITDVPTAAGFLYLAVVLDAFRIVGWAMANHLRSMLALDALEMAVTRRKPRDGLHHSDQGSQYPSLAFGNRAREADVRPATGSVGDAYENAMAESFFSALECDRLVRRRFRSQAEARMAMLSDIEGFHNPLRRHSAPESRSPSPTSRTPSQRRQNRTSS